MDKANISAEIRLLIDKYDALKRRDHMDLSSDQDLSIAIMNLISIEEHLFFSGAKTGNHEYFDLIKEVRDMRKGLLQKIITTYDGESWCISKHLLAASYRLLEVGSKQLDQGNNQEAYDFFNKAYDLYVLFWGLVTKIVSTSETEKAHSSTLPAPAQEKNRVTTKLKGLVSKVINCCIE